MSRIIVPFLDSDVPGIFSATVAATVASFPVIIRRGPLNTANTSLLRDELLGIITEEYGRDIFDVVVYCVLEGFFRVYLGI